MRWLFKEYFGARMMRKTLQLNGGEIVIPTWPVPRVQGSTF